ncbi:MAG: hypothetical protein K2J25_00635 [Oscillospiraceae bacterium]|nr:hypothetical protein [Oscillospiraceae bacterium]
MTNAQILKDRIRFQCEKQEKSITTMLSELSLGINAVNQINEKKGMGAFTLSKIADYLGCSVDYLLGRTDSTDSITISGNTQRTVHEDNSISASSTSDEMTAELVKAFQSMNFVDKMEIMNAVLEKVKK